jgi:predicted nucleic acid-binding protein
VNLVLDASAAVYVASSEAGFLQLREHRLYGPPLLWSESTSALHQTLWRGAISAALAGQALNAFLGAPIERTTPGDLMERAWRIADELGWAKTYDAEYVALAQIIGAPLLTRDARMRRGASRLIKAIGPMEL